MRRFLSLSSFLALLWWGAPSAQAQTFGIQPHIKVELICENQYLQPGQPVTVGLHFKIDKGWHIYWSNPGDSGLTPSLTWNLPNGFEAQPILWPVPEKISLPSLADYGYLDDVTLMVPLTVPSNATPGNVVSLSVMARWLVCDEICIPGKVKLKLKMVVKTKPSAPSNKAGRFAAARLEMPDPWPAKWKAQGVLDSGAFHLTFHTGKAPFKAVFYPLHPNQIDNAAAQPFEPKDHSFKLTLKRSDQLATNVQTLEGLLLITTKNGESAFAVAIPLSSK